MGGKAIIIKEKRIKTEQLLKHIYQSFCKMTIINAKWNCYRTMKSLFIFSSPLDSMSKLLINIIINIIKLNVSFFLYNLGLPYHLLLCIIPVALSSERSKI